jgi:hypothetical protein
MNHQELSEWDIYNLGRYARHAAEGWFYVELAPDSDGNRCLGLVHEDVPCAHSDCTLARVRGHRHTATPERRQEMQDLYVTPWLTHLCISPEWNSKHPRMPASGSSMTMALTGRLMTLGASRSTRAT